MHTDLMCAPRDGHHPQQRMPSAPCQHPVFRAAGPPPAAHAPLNDGPVRQRNGRVDGALLPVHQPLGHGIVHFLHRGGQQRRGIGVHRAQHKAGGSPVQPVHRTEHGRAAPRGHPAAESIGQRAVRIPPGGMYRLSRGLVQHHCMGILIQDIQRQRLGQHLRRRLRRQRKGNPLAR